MKTQCAGAVVALTAGLLMGAAMRPELLTDDRPAGPQIFEGAAGGQASGPFDDGVALAAYKGKLPDYVLGTDLKKLTEPLPPPRLPPDPAPPPTLDARALTPAAYDESAAPLPAFGVDDAYDDASRAEKTPRARAPGIEDEAPPEATGDTQAAR